MTFRPVKRRGIGLIEMLIALSISTILLLAVGMAFNASFKSYSENQQIVDTVQDSRLLLHRVMMQTRRSSYLNVTSEGRRIQIETPDDAHQYVYVYVPAENHVLLSRVNLSTLHSENLGTIDNVVNFVIPQSQWGENPPRLTVSLTVRVGGNESTLTASAVPRSTIEF